MRIESSVGKKENPASDPSALAKIQADIDARNPTKPGNLLANLFH